MDLKPNNRLVCFCSLNHFKLINLLAQHSYDAYTSSFKLVKTICWHCELQLIYLIMNFNYIVDINFLIELSLIDNKKCVHCIQFRGCRIGSLWLKGGKWTCIIFRSAGNILLFAGNSLIFSRHVTSFWPIRLRDLTSECNNMKYCWTPHSQAT